MTAWQFGQSPMLSNNRLTTMMQRQYLGNLQNSRKPFDPCVSGWQFEIAPGATFTYPEIYELEVECDDGQDKSEKVRFHAHVVPQQNIAWAYGGRYTIHACLFVCLFVCLFCLWINVLINIFVIRSHMSSLMWSRSGFHKALQFKHRACNKTRI